MSSSSKSKSTPQREPRSGTPGGSRLRAVRERAGRSQLWVEAEADLGTGYLQRVESGRVAQPSRATVERILAALGARYSERRDVPFPAYVLDCFTRLIAWNRFVPRLLGRPGAEATLDGLVGRSLLASWFDPGSLFGALLVEPDVFLPALARALRFEIEQYRHEPWVVEMLAQLQADLPSFRRVWEQAVSAPAPISAARTLVPLRLNVRGVGQLQFRLVSEPFVRDTRFRLIYYVPADPPTMRQCAAWAGE